MAEEERRRGAARRGASAPQGEVTLFASCAPGLEAALGREAQGLPGLGSVEEVPGGALLRGDGALLYEANLRLRCASRVILRLGRFRARTLPQLVEACAALPWERYLRGPALRPSVTCHRCRIYHSGAAAERLGLGVAARLGLPAPALGDGGRAPGPAHTDARDDDDDGEGGDTLPRVLLRGQDDEWDVSIDTSGALLHRRGYRAEQGEAPLRETLAAGLLLLAGYEGGPLLDLCTGSGTFAIEAGLLRRRIAPGLLRRFAFEGWPSHDAAAYERRREAARAEALPPGSPGDAPAILGVDLDGRAIARAADNGRRAGLGGEVAFRQGDLFLASVYGDLLTARGPQGLFVSINPPYGRRLGARGGEVPFYRRLGRHLRAHLGGARALVLCGHRQGVAALDLGLPVLRLRNGGLPIDCVVGEIGAAGGPQRPRSMPAPRNQS